VLSESETAATLAVVVIARNETSHIGACLASIGEAIRPHPSTQVVVVDSASSDDTVAIACQYPVQVYRYTAPILTPAAGRRIGFERVKARYVLFVDGDCCLEADWIRTGLAVLEATPDVAVVYGARREVFEETESGYRSDGPSPEEYHLGGNALYRARVLHQVGGFNPFIIADEEAELLGRIRAAGYRPQATPECMFTHYTPPKDSVNSLLRYSRGKTGVGQVLRLALHQGQLGYHARRLNRYLLTLAYLLGLVFLALAGLIWQQPAWPLLGLAVGAMAFAGLALRRRNVRNAVFIAADWVMAALFMSVELLQRPRFPEQFAPDVERLK